MQTLEKLAIHTIVRFLQLKPVLQYHISLIILDVTQGEAAGAGYNRVQRGLPPRAVPNPNDPSYFHFPEVCVLLNTLYSRVHDDVDEVDRSLPENMPGQP